MHDRLAPARGALHPTFVPIVALIVVAHASLLLLAPVNLEYAFVDAAQFFLTHRPALIQEYFSVQANTVGMPFLAAQLSRLLPGVPLLEVTRLIVLAGVPLLAAAMPRVCRALGRGDAHLVMAYVLLNPLVWIYAGRATADFFPMALGIWAISLVLQTPLSLRRALVGGLVLGLAAVLKYHAAFLVLPVAAYHLRGAPRAWPFRSAAVFVAGVAAPLCAYLLVAHDAFGFWLTPPEFQVKHQFGSTGFASNLVCYAGYLTLLAMPTLPFLPEVARALARRWRPALLALAAMAAIGFFCIADNGEMNLGPADRWVPPSMRAALFAALSTGLALPLWLRRREDGRFPVTLWCAIVAMLVVFSLTRPAQRYLLFVLPLVIALLPAQLFSRRSMLVTTLSLFVLANAFVEYSRACTGTASERMAAKIVELGLATSTDLGAISPHVGPSIDHVPPLRTDYIVVKDRVPDAIAVSQAGLPILPVTYSLVRFPPARGAPGR